MVDVALAEHHNLLTIFHNSLRFLMYTVYKYLIREFFLHLGDINNASVSQFLKLGIIDVGTVHRRYLVMLVMIWREHKRVVGCCRCELYVIWDTLIGVYHRMNLNTSFLSACLGMTTNTLEYGIGKQAYGR